MNYIRGMLSFTEENYLKAIFHLTIEREEKETAMGEIAGHLKIKPATANEMLKKLKEKKLIHHEKYGRVSMTNNGKKHAVEVVRKHRLWETFLFEKLGFDWDEVHEVAEQLEHIKSKKLINELDRFLDFPSVDPHGEIIPNAKGEMKIVSKVLMSSVAVKKSYVIIGVKSDDALFLQYMEKLGCRIGRTFIVKNIQSFDQSIEIEINGKNTFITSEVASHILVRPSRVN